MIWVICAVLAVLAMVMAGFFGLNKRFGSLRVVYTLLFLAAATYIFYIPVLSSEYGGVPMIIGGLLNLFRVVSLETNYLDAYQMVWTGLADSPWLAELYLLLLGVIHITMPLVSALTAVTVFLKYFSAIQLRMIQRSKRPLFLFSEVNERTMCLAATLPKKSKIIFCGCDEDTINSKNDTYRNYVFREESITDISVKHNALRDTYYILISADEDETLGASLELMQEMSQLSEEIQTKLHVFLFSEYQDYAVYVDSAEKGQLDVRCFSECDMLAYQLLDQYPLYRYAKDNVIHVLLHGLSPLNMAFLKAAAWCGQISGYTLKISALGIDIQDEIQELKHKAPSLFADMFHVDFYDCHSNLEIEQTIREHCADAGYIVIDCEMDNQTMETGIMLRRLFYRMDETFQNCPPIFCYIKDAAKYAVLKDLKTAESNPKRKMSYDLTPFGSLDALYVYEEIVDSNLEKLAQNVHLAYEEIFSDGPIDVANALKGYRTFEVNKRSNRANALHIRYKLGMLGLDYTLDSTARPMPFRQLLDDASLKKLAIAEHDRWMAFLAAEGWTVATAEEVEAYRASGISRGRHNCPLLKMHPYICEYEKLEELSMHLEGKDTTVYDAELITRIPDILGDKWNVSGKKFKIIKANTKE